MKVSLKYELEELLGSDVISTDYTERLLYSHDLAALPKIIANNYQFVPDVVVRPKSAQQISSLQSFAYKNSIPVVPRGHATTSLGGAIPVHGGIVLDISALNRKISFDRERQQVTTDAGVTCGQLLNFLRKEGFTLYTYPTSAPSATVGGWLSAAGMGVGKAGLGVGSSKYGSAAESVYDLEVVLPNGNLMETIALSEYKLRNFLGTDGILGVITKATLRVRELPPVQKPISFVFSDIRNLCMVVAQSSSLKPFFTVFEDIYLLGAKAQAGISDTIKTNIVTFVLEGTATEINYQESYLCNLAICYGGQELGSQAAQREWEGQFYSMRVKRAGPSLIGGEIVLSMNQLIPAITEINLLAKKWGAIIGLRGIPVEQEVMLMAHVLCDERKILPYVTLLPLVRDLHRLAISLGGYPYGVGLFNAFYALEVHGEEFSRLKMLKQELDPKKIMNPGKGICHTNRHGIHIPRVAYNLAMTALGLLRRFCRNVKETT